MSINIPESILGLKGQRINQIDCNELTNSISISCHRLQIEIELARVLAVDGKRHIEHCDFVDKGC